MDLAAVYRAVANWLCSALCAPCAAASITPPPAADEGTEVGPTVQRGRKRKSATEMDSASKTKYHYTALDSLRPPSADTNCYGQRTHTRHTAHSRKGLLRSQQDQQGRH